MYACLYIRSQGPHINSVRSPSDEETAQKEVAAPSLVLVGLSASALYACASFDTWCVRPSLCFLTRHKFVGVVCVYGQ